MIEICSVVNKFSSPNPDIIVSSGLWFVMSSALLLLLRRDLACWS